MALFPLMPADSPALDEDDLDDAFDRAASLSRLSSDNRIRARHGLAPLEAREMLDEVETDRLRRLARESAVNRYGK